jgi:outer membrane protein assembly complex protein YaeT
VRVARAATGWLCVAWLAVALVAAADEIAEPARAWPLERLELDVGGFLQARRVRELLSITPRPWYAPWRDRPIVDRTQVDDDAERVRIFYRTRGYYHAEVTHALAVDAETGRATVRIAVTPGPPVRVTAVHVELGTRTGFEELPQLAAKVPLAPGDVFDGDVYEQGRVALRTFYRGRGFARARVEKRAVVDVRTDAAEVWYRIRPGPPHCTFGSVAVEGLGRVTEDVVRREITFARGDPFTPAAIEKTRSRLQELHLFQSVRMVEDERRDRSVDLTIVVREEPHREVRLGVGYDTEEGARGLAEWRSFDFLGGARQLGFSARASLIRRTVAADFLQPHFPFLSTRFRLLFVEEEEDEKAFTVLRTRVMPRFEWDVVPRLSAYVFYRAEYDHLSSVPSIVQQTLAPDATPTDAVLSGAGFGLDWVDVDDVLDPTRGWSLGGQVEPVGGVLGGDASFLRVGAIGRGWAPLPWRVVVASRLGVGIIEPFGGTTEVPIWERAFAGGADSVRGYDRQRVGPLVANDPIGGQSWAVGSVELRRPVWKALTGSVFTDVGYVARDTFFQPYGQVQIGVGAGLRVATPIGPLRFDLGFPVDPRGTDAAWQFYFGVGQSF